MSRRQSIGRTMARKQSSAAPPEMQFVSVAVLPPRLPPGMAPPTGVGTAGVFGWEESINWSHNERIERPGAERKKSFLQKAGITGERAKRNPDLPPFTFRQVPYDTWRKHYAKDKEGNYQGTHAPAEDCLLKPDDVAKWRLEAPRTKADQWTRGTEVLPVYDEVQAEGQAPLYDFGHDNMSYDAPPPGEPTLEDMAGQNHMASVTSQREHAQRTTSNASTATDNKIKPYEQPSGKIISNGRTAQEIIEEAKNKPKEPKAKGFKNTLKRGTEYMLMGTNM